MGRAFVAVLALSVLVLTACPANERTGAPTTDPTATAPNGEALDQFARQYEQAVRAADRQALQRMHTEDAWLSFGSGQSGSPGEVLADTAANLTLETRRTEVIGEWAYATGTWRQSIQAPGAPAQQLEGHYLTVFRHENGEWRIREVVSNLSEESQRVLAQMQQQPPPPAN